MAVTGWWARLAAGGTVPVFAAAGVDAWPAVQELRAADRVRLVRSPRHAVVLLVAGAVPAAHAEALRRVHDQLPHPRAAVAWRPAMAAADIPTVRTVTGGIAAVEAALAEAFDAVLASPSHSAADLLPDVEPNEWRGVGPHGQGGEGMMGGTPYGRPMAMTGEDRDGLALDRLQVRLGPFLAPLPGGVVLDVTLQGEVLQRVEVASDDPAGAPRRPTDDPAGPVDPARDAARGTLRWLAHGLHVEGLDALAARAAVLARRLTDGQSHSPAALAALTRRVRRSGVLRTLHGVGRLIDAQGATTDAADRWRARLATLTASHDGAATPDTASMAAPAVVSMPDALVGLTLTDAVSTLVSLDPAGAVTAGGGWSAR